MARASLANTHNRRVVPEGLVRWRANRTRKAGRLSLRNAASDLFSKLRNRALAEAGRYAAEVLTKSGVVGRE